jgi:hypothetical protein
MDGAWWPLREGGVEVRFGDGFSGVHLRLNATGRGFDGEGWTYQDVGDDSFSVHVTFLRVLCVRSPTVALARRGMSGPPIRWV